MIHSNRYFLYIVCGCLTIYSLSCHALLIPKKDYQRERVIYLYNGPGTSEESVRHTEHTLKHLVNQSYTIHKIGPKEVAEGLWVKDAVLFIMPGGADIPYVKHLKSVGNNKIKDFVKKGGSYLGFCAGAYYGSRSVEFARHSPLEVVGKRELAFFPGRAVGPTLAKYDYKTNSGARAVEVQWNVANSSFPVGKKFLVYYNGGGHFENAKKYKAVKILAKYPSLVGEKAAIIEIPVGKGKVILSGVHCEYAPKLLNNNDRFLRPIKKTLLARNQEATLLMSTIVERLKISTQENTVSLRD